MPAPPLVYLPQEFASDFQKAGWKYLSDISDELGLSRMTVHAFFFRNKHVTLRNTLKLAELLGVSLTELIEVLEDPCANYRMEQAEKLLQGAQIASFKEVDRTLRISNGYTKKIFCDGFNQNVYSIYKTLSHRSGVPLDTFARRLISARLSA